MIELTKRAKIATGVSRVVDWEQYGGSTGVFVDVDTSPAGFTKTPTYITSLHGTGAHWRTTGGNAVYNAGPRGFRVYIQFEGRETLTTEIAKRHGWHIQWIGIED